MKRTSSKKPGRSERDARTGPLKLALPENRDTPADDIRTRAYEIFLNRVHTGAQGDHVSDWLQAERESAVRRARCSAASQEPPSASRGPEIVIRAQSPVPQTTNRPTKL